MARDQVIGATILIASIAVAVLYLWLLFLSPESWHWWAVAIPMFIAVTGILAILGWIGYTMATTPPPMPIEEFETDTEIEESGEEE
jgi:predicted DNA-binding transcriptional regulator